MCWSVFLDGFIVMKETDELFKKREKDRLGPRVA